MRCKELGERAERPFIRWKHTIAGPGTEGVKVHQVTHQGDIQYFSDLLEIIVFVHQLERLRSVVKTLVGPIGKIVRSVGNESLPAVPVAREAGRLGEILVVGVWHEEREIAGIELTDRAPFVLPTINRIEAAVWTRREIGTRVLGRGIPAKLDPLHGHLGLVAIGQLRVGLFHIGEVPTGRGSPASCQP